MQMPLTYVAVTQLPNEISSINSIRLIYNDKAPVLPALNVIKLRAMCNRPLVNLAKVSACVLCVCQQYDLVPIQLPAHGGKISVALQRLSDVVDAMTYVILTRRV